MLSPNVRFERSRPPPVHKLTSTFSASHNCWTLPAYLCINSHISIKILFNFSVTLKPLGASCQCLGCLFHSQLHHSQYGVHLDERRGGGAPIKRHTYVWLCSCICFTFYVTLCGHSGIIYSRSVKQQLL